MAITKVTSSLTSFDSLLVDSDNTDTTITVESDLDGSSLFTSGIDLRREGVSKGSRVESIRDASVGGVGLNFLTTADNAAEVSGTLTSRMVILESGEIGVGTSQPSSGIHLSGASNTASKITLTNTASNNTWAIHPEYNSQTLHISEDGTNRVSVAAGGDLTATNIYAGGSAVQNGTLKKNYACTTSYPNGSTDSFTLSASEAPIGSWVNLGIYISSGNSGGDQYLYLRQTNGYGSYLYGYVDSWYYTWAASNWWYIGTSGDRTFSITHGTIADANANDFRRVLYFGYKMDN